MRKNKIFVLVAIMLLNIALFSVNVSANGISVYVNDVLVNTEVEPCIVSDRTMIPVRAVCDALGCLVNWDEQEQTVTIERENIKNVLKIGSLTAKKYISGVEHEVTLEVPAQIISGRTMVPARYVAESIGADVYWNGETKNIAIYLRESPGLYLVGENTVRIDDYAHTLPVPDRIDIGMYGVEWYVYNSNYAGYKMIAVRDGIVIGFFTLANGFSTNIGVGYGAIVEDKTLNGYNLKIYRDNSKGGAVFGIMVIKNDTSASNEILASDAFSQSQATELFEMTNAYRVSNGFGPLLWDAAAGHIASKHSSDMAYNNFFGHDSSNGASVIDRYLLVNPIEWNAIGENIEGGHEYAADILDSLINSPGQRAHILSAAFKYLGTGFTYAKYSQHKYYAVQVFVAY